MRKIKEHKHTCYETAINGDIVEQNSELHTPSVNTIDELSRLVGSGEILSSDYFQAPFGIILFFAIYGLGDFIFNKIPEKILQQ